MPLTSKKKCRECGSPIIGRIDKRFCSDQCRNTFNNRLNGDVTRYIRNINNALRKNRRILMALNPEGRARIRRDMLIAEGFDFSHVTSIYTNKDGVKYFYCYEQGYLPIEKDCFLLVVKKQS
jgi:hypothetical protein